MSSLALEFEAEVLGPNGDPWSAVIDLQWFLHDPCVVHMVFPYGYPTWVVSRDLLADGLRDGSAGKYDVSVILDPFDEAIVEIVLSPLHGQCAVRLDRIDVDAFLRSTLARVPFGAEVIAPANLTTAELTEWDGGSA